MDPKHDNASDEKVNPEHLENRDDDSLVFLDAAEEEAMRKRVLRKLDVRVLPVLWLLFLFSFLDRTSIGNASILGLKADLNLSSLAYSQALALYFLFYILAEVPATLVLKKAGPKVWLPVMTAAWGIVTITIGFVQSAEGLFAVRCILGMAEGGLLPCMVLYLSTLYKRDEMGIRLALAYVSNPLSGAFGGLLATGLNKMNGLSGIAGWRWIFIIEGIMTIIVGAGAYFILCNDVATAPFLTPTEQAWAVQRLANDKPKGYNPDGTDADSFSWRRVRQGLFSLQLWLSALSFFSILSALYSFGLFVPTIIKGLGYTAVEAQLYSVPPYVTASALTLCIAGLSDRMKRRGPFMLCTLPISIIGYALIRTTTSNNVKYGALFLMSAGLYSSVPPVLVWLSNNTAPHYKRATTAAMQLAIANCSGFVATFVYPSTQGPAYVPGHTIILGILCGGWCCVAANVLYCTYENKQKRAGKRDQFLGCGDDRDPTFLYVI